MPPRDWRLRIGDILDAITEIQLETEGMTIEAFRADRRTIGSVLYRFLVIGEASSHVPVGIQQLNPDVPWTMMSSMRNILIHEYFGTDLSIVWSTIQIDLPVVQKRLEIILQAER